MSSWVIICPLPLSTAFLGQNDPICPDFTVSSMAGRHERTFLQTFGIALDCLITATLSFLDLQIQETVWIQPTPSPNRKDILDSYFRLSSNQLRAWGATELQNHIDQQFCSAGSWQHLTTTPGQEGKALLPHSPLRSSCLALTAITTSFHHFKIGLQREGHLLQGPNLRQVREMKHLYLHISAQYRFMSSSALHVPTGLGLGLVTVDVTALVNTFYFSVAEG